MTTQGQLDDVAQQVNQTLQEGGASSAEVQRQTDKLMSLSQLTNERINATNARLKELKGSLIGFTVETRASVESISKYITLLIRKIVVAGDMNDHLKQFLQGAEELGAGHLSPDIITPEQLNNTIANVTAILKRNFPNYQILSKDLPYYYEHGKVALIRINETLIVDLKFPLTTLGKDFHLYRIPRVRVPVSEDRPHSTEIKDLPPFVAMTSDLQYYIPFQSEPKITSSMIDIKNERLINSTNTCMLALFQNNPQKIHLNCQSSFFKTPAESSAVRLTGTSVWLTNVSKYTLLCADGNSVHEINCTYCLITIPCHCTVYTCSHCLPARLQNCQKNTEISSSNLINLKGLWYFFNESKLISFSGDTMVDQINVSLPIFKIDDEKESTQDHEIRFHMEKLADEIKNDREIFHTHQS